MSIIRLRQVKSEIRLLGISFKSGRKGLQAVGVVFKGNKALDGVLTSLIHCKDMTLEVEKMMKASKHFNQIRVVLYNKTEIPGDYLLDPYKLFELTGKPTLCLCKGVKLDERFMLRWNSWVIYSAGLGENDAVKVLDISSRDNIYPEVLRVSSLVSHGLHNI